MSPFEAPGPHGRHRTGRDGDDLFAGGHLHPGVVHVERLGRFLYQFGITAAVAVLVSLLVSFTLTP